jgi:hypothetical protein
MKLVRPLLSLAFAGAVAACGSIPTEPETPAGALRGSVVYSGPHPCSSNGHIVGAAILFVFDRRNLPPPSGLASAPVTFGVVTGDALFANEPRSTGSATYCPKDHGVTDTITVSAPFAISPVAGGSYVIQSFYDYTGYFLPNFKFSDLPEQGDIGGGDIDTVDALKAINAGNPNYQPHFVPVDVGTPEALPDGAPDVEIPNFTLPNAGVVVDNLTVTVGAVLPMTRPYFYPGGMATSFDPSTGILTTTEPQTSAAPPTNLDNIEAAKQTEANKYFDPILTIAQDLQVLAAPTQNVEPNVNNFESKFPRLLLHGGLASKLETSKAVAAPFHFQLGQSDQTGAFTVWQNALFDGAAQKWVAQDTPAAKGIPQLWPLVVLTKLIDDPGHTLDPASLTTQGSSTAPVVIIQGITLLEGDGSDATKPDSLFNSGTAEAFGNLFDPSSGQPTIFTQDHLTVVLPPVALCFDTLFDSNNPDKHGRLVSPHLTGATADVSQPVADSPIITPSLLANPQVTSLISGAPIQACLPTGRYAINVVYPDGQAWTVPNEAGACFGAEGATDYAHLTCTLEPRPVLYSQGTRAVVEVVPASNPAHCTGASAVPAVCKAMGTQ